MNIAADQDPLVSFIVPCYKLAHLLPECLDSILSQSYTNLEILIMDDSSPDDTPRVAKSYSDPRIRYIRNEPNLGHLRNYNKGIELCKGKYVWLISADDKLLKNYILDRYVKLLEQHPQVGCAFCAGLFLENGKETRLIKDSWWGDRDVLFKGHDFFVRLYRGDANIVCPSCLVRKECYDNVGKFLLDMPHAGDRYLWSLWALTYDVAYFSEPMVGYRLHDLNIMKSLKRSNVVHTDLLKWQTRIRSKAVQAGNSELVATWETNVSNLLAYSLLSDRFQISAHCMNFEEFEESLRMQTQNLREEKVIRARVYAGFADGCYEHGQTGEALQYYLRALRMRPVTPRVWGKFVLVRAGKPGILLRKFLTRVYSKLLHRGEKASPSKAAL